MDLKAREPVPRVRDVHPEPGRGMLDQQLIPLQRALARHTLEQVTNLPELLELLIDLSQILEIQLQHVENGFIKNVKTSKISPHRHLSSLDKPQNSTLPMRSRLH